VITICDLQEATELNAPDMQNVHGGATNVAAGGHADADSVVVGGLVGFSILGGQGSPALAAGGLADAD
jgi:hypothetical protein